MTQISRRAALVSVLALGVAGCAPTKPAVRPGSSPSVSGPTADATPTATPSPPPPTDTRPRWPLTGALVANASLTRHAAVAVKVADNQWEHPQRGIDEADIVFVELEGYLGRRRAQLDPPRPGVPLPTGRQRRSGALHPPVDVALLSPMDAIIANTGAARWVVNYVKAHQAHLEGMLSYANTTGTGSYGTTDPSRVYTQNGQTH